MKYHSTRGGTDVSLDEALLQGIAEDGGLFIPDRLPTFSTEDFEGLDSISEVARVYLRPFFEGSSLNADIDDILGETFSFPIPVSTIPVDNGYAGLLELFHGPTAAFKDVGAGFLAACISRLDAAAESPLTILVATSGDTGGAVAAAFDERPGIRVVVLYPDGRVSERQAHQLTCWSDNVLSLAVQGSFDDCQALVKAVMNDPVLRNRHRFSSANSINIGRLLPQSIYYADSSLRHYRETGNKLSYIVPTGNLGNALACVMARQAGMPIGEIVLATNANRLIVDFLQGGEWLPRASIQTLASAMDVGNPSNMERLRAMHGEADELNDVVQVCSVSDDEIEKEIREYYSRYGVAICPHTATASVAYHRMDAGRREASDWILVSTAHPAKFESIVEPLIGSAVELPAGLAQILTRESKFTRIEPTMAALIWQLDELSSGREE